MKVNRGERRGHREKRKKFKLRALCALCGEKVVESISQPMKIHKIEEKR